MNLEILQEGFIPREISEKLPENFSDVENLANNLPKVLGNEQIEEHVLRIETDKDISNLDSSQLERAMLLYSYIGHAYMWGKKK